MSRRLLTIARKFYLQSERILNTFNNTLHPEVSDCCKNSHGPTRQQCVLNLYDAWTQFSKELLIYSAQGGYETSGNTVLSRATNVINTDPLNFIYSLSNRYNPTTPPSWGIASELIGIARRLGLANYSTVSAAIGSINSPAETVRISRNYIAHKNKLTANKAINSLRTYGATSSLDIDKILLTRTARGVSVFEDWRNGLVTIAFSCCK